MSNSSSVYNFFQKEDNTINNNYIYKVGDESCDFVMKFLQYTNLGWGQGTPYSVVIYHTKSVTTRTLSSYLSFFILPRVRIWVSCFPRILMSLPDQTSDLMTRLSGCRHWKDLQWHSLRSCQKLLIKVRILIEGYFNILNYIESEFRDKTRVSLERKFEVYPLTDKKSLSSVEDLVTWRCLTEEEGQRKDTCTVVLKGSPVVGTDGEEGMNDSFQQYSIVPLKNLRKRSRIKGERMVEARSIVVDTNVIPSLED